MQSALKKAEPEDPFHFYKRKMLRLIPAYFLVAIPFYVLAGGGMIAVLYHLSFVSLVREGVRDFWYVAAMILAYLLFPLFLRLQKRLGALLVFVIFTVANCLLECLILFAAPSLYDHVEILVIRLLCFWLGCFAGCLQSGKQKKEQVILGIFCAGIAAFLVISRGFSILSMSNRELRFFFIPVSLLICYILPAMLRLLPKVLKRVLSWLGTRTLELYLVHVSFGAWVSSRTADFHMGLLLYFVVSLMGGELVYLVTNQNRRLLR